MNKAANVIRLGLKTLEDGDIPLVVTTVSTPHAYCRCCIIEQLEAASVYANKTVYILVTTDVKKLPEPGLDTYVSQMMDVRSM